MSFPEWVFSMLGDREILSECTLALPLNSAFAFAHNATRSPGHNLRCAAKGIVFMLVHPSPHRLN